MKVLCGDIGGTSTRLALYEWGASPTLLAKKTFQSASFAGLEDALEAFEFDGALGAAGFGVAGPVENGRVEATNLPWVVSAASIAAHLALPEVALVNDLAALAYGADYTQNSWRTLQAASTASSARLFVGAGTGLGVAFETADGVYPSEGGHIAFAPRDDDEVALWRRAKERFGRVSAERLISGSALPLLFEHFAERHGAPEALRRDVRLRGGEAISAGAAQGDPSSKETLTKFVSLLGSVAGDLCLVLRPRSLMLAGGLTLKLVDSLPDFAPRFMSAFHDKGRMRALNEKVGVHIVADEGAALVGAAASAIRCAISGST